MEGKKKKKKEERRKNSAKFSGHYVCPRTHYVRTNYYYMGTHVAAGGSQFFIPPPSGCFFAASITTKLLNCFTAIRLINCSTGKLIAEQFNCFNQLLFSYNFSESQIIQLVPNKAKEQNYYTI